MRWHELRRSRNNKEMGSRGSYGKRGQDKWGKFGEIIGTLRNKERVSRGSKRKRSR